jgi:hypothetical protein
MRGSLLRIAVIVLLFCSLFASSSTTIVRNSSAAQDYKTQVVRDVDADGQANAGDDRHCV